ncbi:RISC-loading complex subunit tarbp2 isoform X2 [Cryptotermes secundus]|nr:RISC-loading complex subunit tarbp2 isoform X2 [Cryptotermes secundus]
MAVAVGKTPVSVLQELLSRRGTTPKYELVQIEGAIHEPTFRYRVTVADVVAMGTGRSKKEAKHAAAKAVLDKLIGSSQEDGSVGTNSTVPEVKAEIISPYDDKIPGNPIGTLQEMCMSRRWPPPGYEMVNEEGLPHERLFTIACVVFKHRETGTGKSKKLAKRQAAHKMWEKLQDSPVMASSVTPGLDEDDEIAHSVANVAARYADLKDSKISTLTTPHSHKVSQFHKNLKLSSGIKLNELQSTSLNNSSFNFVQFLQEIASEQQFEVTYVDIEEKSITGKWQCLVQLSTLPVAVCYGSGNSSKEAQASAAQNALEYLKIMTKK